MFAVGLDVASAEFSARDGTAFGVVFAVPVGDELVAFGSDDPDALAKFIYCVDSS